MPPSFKRIAWKGSLAYHDWGNWFIGINYNQFYIISRCETLFQVLEYLYELQYFECDFSWATVATLP